MKKVFYLILITSLSLLLTSCKTNSNEVIRLSSEKHKELTTTETIIIIQLSSSNGEIEEARKIIDSNEIENIIDLISKGIKISNDEDVSNVKTSYKLEMLDYNDKVIDIINIYDGQNGWIEFENTGDNYSLDIKSLLEILEIKN